MKVADVVRAVSTETVAIDTLPEELYPKGWLARARALDEGRAQPLDWEHVAEGPSA